MKRSYYILLFLLLFLFILIFSLWNRVGTAIKSINDRNCHFDNYVISQLTGLSCDYNLLSYSSDSNEFSGMLINSDKIKILDNQTLNKTDMLITFFDKKMLPGTNLFFDNQGGYFAGLMVFVARSLGLSNFYLYDGVKLSSELYGSKKINLSEVTTTGDQTWVTAITGEFGQGYIGNGKFKLVFDVNSLNLQKNDLLLYLSDKGSMQKDDFYINNNDRITIKNMYFAFLMDQDGKIKDKTLFVGELLKYSIEPYEYQNVYLYYPDQRWKGGLIALTFSDYFR